MTSVNEQILNLNNLDWSKTMNIIDNYLEFLDENKWTQMLKAGKLKPTDLRRIQKSKAAGDPLLKKALEKGGKAVKSKSLKNTGAVKKATSGKGMVKSAKQAGVEKGTENILKKKGIKSRNIPQHQFTKAMDVGGSTY